MQSQVKAADRPEKMTIASTTKYIYQHNGIKGFYRGALPRIGLGMWQTLCMVALGKFIFEIICFCFIHFFLGDYFRAFFGTK